MRAWRSRAPRFFEALLPDEGEDAVGVLGELDRTDPERIGTKYTDVMSAWTSPPVRNDHAIQWNTAVPAANAKPASSAPPGRRTPNVTGEREPDQPDQR